jgi:hypothetical protein
LGTLEDAVVATTKAVRARRLVRRVESIVARYALDVVDLGGYLCCVGRGRRMWMVDA